MRHCIMKLQLQFWLFQRRNSIYDYIPPPDYSLPLQERLFYRCSRCRQTYFGNGTMQTSLICANCLAKNLPRRPVSVRHNEFPTRKYYHLSNCIAENSMCLYLTSFSLFFCRVHQKEKCEQAKLKFRSLNSWQLNYNLHFMIESWTNVKWHLTNSQDKLYWRHNPV